MILSQGLYSDGIGSLIRELTTNALDSQREAKNTTPIKVSLVKDNGKFVFSVQDEGVGLSPDRVENVFSKYCSSTKRDSDEQLGFFGLGSKAPLSYTDSFYIISRYEGIEYKYMMFKGEEGTQLSLMDMNDTTEHNGVTIKVTLKEEEDYEIFLEKMKRQLAYFEGVFFTTEYDDISNDFKIIKNETWKYSELNQDRYLHMAMDNVYYPLDFEKLGIEPIAIPMAISVSIKDGIVPTPNREQILYTPQTKALVLSKLKTLANFLVNKWNSIAPEAIDLFTAEKLYNSHGVVPIWEDPTNSKSISVKLDKKIEKLSDVPMIHISMPTYPHLSIKRMIETKASMFNNYAVTSVISYNKYTTKVQNWQKKVEPNHRILLLHEGESLTKLQIEFIKWKQRTYDIVRKVRDMKLGPMKPFNNSVGTYYGLLELRNKPRNLWRIMIDEYCQLTKASQAKWDTIANVEPTQEFLDWKKANRIQQTRRNLLKEEVTVGIARPKDIYDHENKPIYEKAVYNIAQLNQMKKNKGGIYIYSTVERANELYPYFQIGQIMKATGHYTAVTNSGKSKKTYNYSRIQCATFSERNYTKIQKAKELKNWINIDNILDKKNRVLADFLSYYLLREFMLRKNNSIALKDTWFLKLLDLTLFEQASKVKLSDREIWTNNISLIPKKLLAKLLKLYIDKDWLNSMIIDPIAYTYQHIDNIRFIQHIKLGGQSNYTKGYPYDVLKPEAYQAEEVRIARTLYAKAALKNYQSSKNLNFTDFINKIILEINPPIRVTLQLDPDDEWNNIRQEADDDDLQPEEGTILRMELGI